MAFADLRRVVKCCKDVAFSVSVVAPPPPHLGSLQHKTSQVREGFKNPRHGNFPLGGYPAPGASTKTAFFAQKTPFLGQFLMDFS